MPEAMSTKTRCVSGVAVYVTLVPYTSTQGTSTHLRPDLLHIIPPAILLQDLAAALEMSRQEHDKLSDLARHEVMGSYDAFMVLQLSASGRKETHAWRSPDNDLPPSISPTTHTPFS